MFKLILHIFLWWWPKLPLWLRYCITGIAGVGIIIGWIVVPEAWVGWLFLALIVGSIALYGEPTEAEKKGYRV